MRAAALALALACALPPSLAACDAPGGAAADVPLDAVPDGAPDAVPDAPACTVDVAGLPSLADRRPGADPSGCGEPVPVTSAAEMLALLPADWAWFCTAGDAPPPVTADLVVASQILLQNADLPAQSAPSNPYTSWVVPPYFVVGPDAAGAAWDPDPASPATATGVRLAPGTYRLRAQRELWIPSGGFQPQVVVLGPCAAPCPEGQWKCPVDDSCHLASPGGPNYFCRQCFGGTTRQCACWTPDGPLPDGTPCGDAVECSDWQFDQGVCVGGICC